MRATPTGTPSARLWRLRRDRRLLAWTFRRQAGVGPYIADFLCYRARLIAVPRPTVASIADDAGDAARMAFGLAGRASGAGDPWNTEILNDGDGVARSILTALEDPLTPLAIGESPSPAGGEGKEGRISHDC